MNILEQVGITKEELIERIVNKALGLTAEYNQTGEDTWEEIPFSLVIDKKINTTIGKVVENMAPLISSMVEEIMSQKIDEVFTKPFYKTNRFGEMSLNSLAIFLTSES